ncbi:MAG: 50S ribosomal protein L11 methyltransferase [Thermodesulfobacteriota bacterium]
MLRPPYENYERLYVYHLDATELPPVSDGDLIGTWIEDGNPILFFHRPKDELIKELCRKQGCKLIYQADLDYADWEAGQEIAPFEVEGVSVAPVWCGDDADITIDPSVIFGSGFHPSTRLCQETLVKYCRTPEVELNSMLDLGAGTGLLAITAAHLGVRKITALDNNPLACEVANRNVRLNDYEREIEVNLTDVRQNPPDTGVDLVVANLYHTLLADLFETPSFWQAKLYIVAGFIPSMEDQLLAALPTRKIRMIERRRSERWCLWVLSPVTD